MIGSFGTLAAIATVNFKLMPRPAGARTFLYQNVSAAPVFAKRDQILKSVLQPAAIDVWNPAAAARLGLEPVFTLAVEAVGSEAVLARYQRELPDFLTTPNDVWSRVREFTPTFLAEFPHAHIVRLSCQLMDLFPLFTATPKDQPLIARAGNGVAYLYARGPLPVPPGRRGVIEFAPQDRAATPPQWPEPGNDFFLMRKIKDLFDPNHLLNQGRLYARL
jgi:glycolate oxidase FAD binding subunit